MVIKTRPDPQTTFVVPFSGQATISEGKRSIQLAPSLIVISPFTQPTTCETSHLHYVSFNLEAALLNRTLSIYSNGVRNPNEGLFPEHSSPHFGKIGAVRYYDQILTLLSLVNNCGGDVDFLSRIGFDQVVTGVFAEFLLSVNGTEFDQVGSRPIRRSSRAVDIICDYIACHLGTPLTTPQMERLTGMTGRAINYAFQERFGRSPQQWQREYLLDMARQELLNPNNTRSIKEIAYDLGFSSASSFSAHYQRKFREQPSASLRSGSASSTPPAERRDI